MKNANDGAKGRLRKLFAIGMKRGRNVRTMSHFICVAPGARAVSIVNGNRRPAKSGENKIVVR
jgi:hypothetical protein